MPWKQHVLVVANVTAGSPELLNVLRRRAEGAPTSVYLVVPATPLGRGREMAAQRLEEALAELRSAGLEADGIVGHADPFVAVTDVWDPLSYDEIIISTLPIGVSRWLHAGLPERIGRVTGALVTHVVAQPPSHELETSPAPPHEDRGILSPLYVLGWGPAKRA
jgi:hypothetical protein